MNHYRLETIYTLLQPLSHIGESESTQSFLNTATVVNDGKPEEVFVYTGNALRGMLRDCGARYLLNRLDIRVPLKAFHLLFSGGSIGGAQALDIDQAKIIRKALPFVSLFGGGVGNQILDGKLKQTFVYPVCRETNNIIPSYVEKSDYSWRHFTNVIEFTRKDDEKNVNLAEQFLIGQGEQQLLEGETTKKKKEKDGPATQMRYGVEYLAAGTKLWHRWDIICDELELGAFVSALHEWQKQPYLGGMSGKGFGLVAADMELVTEDGREQFAQIGQEFIKLGTTAEQAKAAYDAHLQEMYDAYLIDNKEEFTKLLAGEVK
ncbi:hypothetical protein [Heyndrickxia coagulans]|uniref:CRISPR type IV/AFERR-associated protein Csf2 n=2 Tax=Bacillaceae TaxID=186817 RepID=A0A8B4BXN5_HEYCO|nr:hypothetical protein [Heyndrickxia coagulans]AJH78526.1 hypothetical protein BF29_2519 [Heyndrickxia coagulans DSM 1 = ATCC 7050]MCR2847874.1 hypothetical protein [Heyndrickxia coagulans]MDR4225285.1 hypothetical protein [Heyndrickxia coagulans DSM 1 = ATCC 7050]MED4492959.1 hypothetical protein [Heyndrickxia coagulans]MED4535706.1 hypothetical protein [Heyndrickxia coagulans]